MGASGTAFFSFDAFDAPKEATAKSSASESAPSAPIAAPPPLPPEVSMPPLPVHPGTASTAMSKDDRSTASKGRVDAKLDNLEVKHSSAMEKGKPKADRWVCPTCDEMNKL